MKIDLERQFGVPADAGIGPMQALWCTPEMKAQLWHKHHLQEAEKYAAEFVSQPQWTHASAIQIARFCGDICVQTVRNWVRKKSPKQRNFKRIHREMVEQILTENDYSFERFCAFLERK